MATNAGHLSIVKYLVSIYSVDPKTEDRNGENCLTLAIKNRKRDVAVWLAKSEHFQLHETCKRGNLNYFAYALIKGQQVVANEIFEVLKSKNLATDEILNQEIETSSREFGVVTLFDLFIHRKYIAGLKFLLSVCKIDSIAKHKKD